MAWYKNENGNSVKPAAVDETSSRKYAYIRKNFELIPAQGEGEETIPEHWQWEETKIPIDAMEILKQTNENKAWLDDASEAITELAELVAGLLEG